MYGGIPRNQIDAPVIQDVDDLNVNSISVSLHKYIGYPLVKSVVLSSHIPDGEHIPYIDQKDTTTSGSRDIMPFSMRQQIIDVLEHSHPEDYIRNIKYFESLLNENSVLFYRGNKSNTFVFNAVDKAISTEYQLCEFADKDGMKKMHVIIFPYHTRESMRSLVNALKAYYVT